MQKNIGDLFGDAVQEISEGTRVTSYQQLTERLLRRLQEKGLTLEECASSKILNRSRRTLEAHCRTYQIAFSDYTPASMRPKGWRKKNTA